MRRAAHAGVALGLAAAAMVVVAGGSDRVSVVAPTGPYLGQDPPGATPVLFAEGIVSTDNNDVSCAFTPDGRYFLFTSRRAGTDDIYWVDASVIESLRGEQGKQG